MTEVNYQEKYVHPLRTRIIVDKSILSTLSAENLSEFLANVYKDAEDRPVEFVASPKLVYNSKALISALETGSPNLTSMLEFNQIVLTENEYVLIRNFSKLKESILAQIDANKIVTPYPFAKVPENWEFEKNIRVKGNVIRRLDTFGNSDGYSIGAKAAQRIWNHFKNFWANNEKYVSTIYIQASGYSNYASNIGKSAIKIGCQQIERHELEQLAVAMDWEFPEECNQLEA